MFVYNSLGDALHRLHPHQGIMKRTPVAGRDINRCSVIELSDGAVLFLKENHKKRFDFFKAEALGLSALASCCNDTGISIPKVIALGGDFLLLEYIAPGVLGNEYWESLGYGLARMHKADTSRFCPDQKYGFLTDNYIGESEQINTPGGNWVDFFREFRLIPQLARATYNLDKEDLDCAQRLLNRLDSYLPQHPAPTLLHGDLWAGNTVAGENNTPWLVDPAVYVGDRECDIAMTELFGEFPRVFYNAYNKEYPLDIGYSRRRDIYNLYHLLNHLNTFGMDYLPGVKRVLRKF